MAFERAFIAIACILVAAGTPAAVQARSDEQAIQRLASQFERAWNTHDMTLLGDMVTDDVDFVNVIGLQWKGGSRWWTRTRRSTGIDSRAACGPMSG